MPGELSGKAAIVGIGATDFSKNSGRSELRLAAEAVLDALDDAGLTPADVDGMVTFTMDSNTEVAIARATGIGDLKFFSKIHHGGGAACATVQQAAIAVATGVADCVVAYRAFNERSGQRFGQVQLRLVENADSTGAHNSFSYPHGLSTPVESAFSTNRSCTWPNRCPDRSLKARYATMQSATPVATAIAAC